MFFPVALAVSFCQAASLIGADALGLEQPPQNAVIVRNGLAPQNPAINAFENKTKFGTSIRFEHANASNGDNSLGLNSFTVPSISMVLPLGFLGTFGIGLEQKYFANNRFELVDTELDANVLYASRTGLYELAPSYSLRLPLFLSDFAIGTSYRIFFGNSYSILERGKSQKWDDNNSWMVNGIQITDKKTGEFKKIDDDWWQSFGWSLHYHKKTADYFVSYFPAVEMEKTTRTNVQFSNSDTLKSKKTTENFKLPEHFASGVNFLFLKKHNVSLVYECQKWVENELVETQVANSYFVEYKLNGTGLHYSQFFQRNNFGINAWYAEKYIKGVTEFGASLLSDLWLGRRGTLVGLQLFGGYRDAEAENYWNEMFFGFKLNLTGVGNWGTSSRRR